jgi:hypothetical protein
MVKVIRILLPVMAITLIMSLMVGCSAAYTGSSTATNDRPSSSLAQNELGSSGQPTSADMQKPDGGGKQPVGNGGQQMEQVISRLAEILNVPEEEFSLAYQNAMSAHMPERPSDLDQQPPQMDGEPPEQPQESPDGEAPEPGQRGQQGPGFDMQEIYDELAEALGISEDDIAAAFKQTQQELSQ